MWRLFYFFIIHCFFFIVISTLINIIIIVVVVVAGDILVTEDVSGLTTVGYDLFISVSDGRNTAGPRSLTVTVAGNLAL